MEPNRSAIRAPGTIIKSARPNTYTGYLAQNKLKLLGSITRERPNPSQPAQSVKTPQQHQQQQQQQVEQSQNSSVSKTAIPALNTTSSNVTSRIPLKPSRLVRPTPIKQPGAERGRQSVDRPSLVTPSSFNTTSALRAPTARTNVNVNTSARPALPSSILKQPSKAQHTGPDKVSSSKPAALTAPPKLAPRTSINVQPNQKENTSDNQVTSSSKDIALTGVSEDVGHIRQLLEQLLTLLKNSSDEHEAMVAENKRLRQELVELKEKIRSVKSTVSTPVVSNQTIPEEGESCEMLSKDKRLPPRSSVYSTPLI